MTGLDSILGQRSAVDLLRRMLAADRIPHALLFRGPEGVGKATTATAFAGVLLCSAGGEPACGQCASCRMLEHRAHTDLMLVTRLPKPGVAVPANRSAQIDPSDLRTAIVVEQIRDLSRLAGMAPREGRRRVFIIDPADRMNAESQNALLKTLEEPPGQTVLILIAARPHLLLPTVRSRCFALGFSALRTADLERLLRERGFDAPEAAERALLADGRVGRALGLDLEAARARREAMLRCLETLSGGAESLGDLGPMAVALAGKDEPTLVEGLDLIQTMLRDAARLAIDPDDPIGGRETGRRLERLGRRLGPMRAAELVAGVDRARTDLRFNVNRTLLAETVLAAVAGAPLP